MKPRRANALTASWTIYLKSEKVPDGCGCHGWQTRHKFNPEPHRPKSLEAYDLCVRSRNQWAVSKSANDEARSHLERAIALDPNYCEAHWRLANSLIFGWLIWGDPQEPNRRKALALAQRAAEIAPNDSVAHSHWVTFCCMSAAGMTQSLQYEPPSIIKQRRCSCDIAILCPERKPKEAVKLPLSVAASTATLAGTIDYCTHRLCTPNANAVLHCARRNLPRLHDHRLLPDLPISRTLMPIGSKIFCDSPPWRSALGGKRAIQEPERPRFRGLTPSASPDCRVKQLPLGGEFSQVDIKPSEIRHVRIGSVGDVDSL